MANKESYLSSQITNIFIGMTLMAALESFLSSQKNIINWMILAYFVLNNIRYYYGDIKWSEVTIKKKANIGLERAIDVFFYVFTRFSILITATYINKIEYFLFFNCISLLIGLISLFYSKYLVYDKINDNVVRRTLNSWITFNIIEFIIGAIGGLFIYIYPDLINNYTTLNESNLLSIISVLTLIFLFIISFSDWIYNKDFLFDEDSDHEDNDYS